MAWRQALAAAQILELDEAMLALRPNCEACDRNLPPESAAARICSFECTFCADCAEGFGACPNCGGELVRRPIRPAHLLEKYPASAARVLAKRGD